MERSKVYYEKKIDAKQIGIGILRSWKWMIAVAVVLGLLLGVLAFRTLPPNEPVPVMTAAQLAEAQRRISDSQEIITEANELNDEAEKEMKDKQKELVRSQKVLEKAMEADTITPELITKLMEATEKVGQVEWEIELLTEEISERNTQIGKLQEEIESLQEKMAETTVPEIGYSPVVTQVALGITMGILLVCIAVILRYILDDRLQSAQEMADQFAVPVLGCVHIPAAYFNRQKHWGIDRLIDRIECGSRIVDAEQEYRLAAAKMQVLVKEHKHVVVTGSVGQEKLAAVCEALQKDAPEGAFQLIPERDIAKNAEAVCKVADSKILLVEEIGASKVADVIYTVEFLRQCEAEVIGAIIL